MTAPTHTDIVEFSISLLELQKKAFGREIVYSLTIDIVLKGIVTI